MNSYSNICMKLWTMEMLGRELPISHWAPKKEVLIFGAALRFSHYLVHLMAIGTILSKIDQYLHRSAASALKFPCLGPYE